MLLLRWIAVEPGSALMSNGDAKRFAKAFAFLFPMRGSSACRSLRTFPYRCTGMGIRMRVEGTKTSLWQAGDPGFTRADQLQGCCPDLYDNESEAFFYDVLPRRL